MASNAERKAAAAFSGSAPKQRTTAGGKAAKQGGGGGLGFDPLDKSSGAANNRRFIPHFSDAARVDAALLIQKSFRGAVGRRRGARIERAKRNAASDTRAVFHMPVPVGCRGVGHISACRGGSRDMR